MCSAYTDHYGFEALNSPVALTLQLGKQNSTDSTDGPDCSLAKLCLEVARDGMPVAVAELEASAAESYKLGGP